MSIEAINEGALWLLFLACFLASSFLIAQRNNKKKPSVKEDLENLKKYQNGNN
jgi:preprotein translocase subunit YajC